MLLLAGQMLSLRCAAEGSALEAAAVDQTDAPAAVDQVFLLQWHQAGGGPYCSLRSAFGKYLGCTRGPLTWSDCIGLPEQWGILGKDGVFYLESRLSGLQLSLAAGGQLHLSAAGAGLSIRFQKTVRTLREGPAAASGPTLDERASLKSDRFCK